MFDLLVSADGKKAIVYDIHNKQGKDNPPERRIVHLSTVAAKSIADFAMKSSKAILDAFGLIRTY